MYLPLYSREFDIRRDVVFARGQDQPTTFPGTTDKEVGAPYSSNCDTFA